MTLYFDTETRLIDRVSGDLAPEMVCFQYAFDEAPPEVLHGVYDADGILAVWEKAFREGHKLVAHFGAFDYAVLAAWDDSLLPHFFKALAQDRVGRDTLLREKLTDIREKGTPLAGKGVYSLGTIAQRRCGLKLSKGQDSWRLRYAELMDKPIETWPRPAVHYAEEDVASCRAVYKHQAKQYESPDEWLQVASAFVLQLAAVYGVRTNAAKLKPLVAQLTAEKEGLLLSLIRQGLWNAEKESVDETALKKLIEGGCKKAGIECPRTEKGNIKTDKESIFKLADQLPDLKDFVEYESVGKILSTYCVPMLAGCEAPLVSSPNALVGTGRTSWQGPNLQNFPRREGIRDCIEPRPGHLWLSVDYDSLELRTLAQCLLWIVGESGLAKGYQSDPDWDPHAAFACSPQLLNLPYEEGVALKKVGDKKFKKYRTLAKAGNFGLPGGSSARTFRVFAEKTYGVILTEQEAKDLRDKWYETFPEMYKYFEYINYLINNGLPYKQFVSQRLRGSLFYTNAANTGFQGLAADGAKRALVRVSNACYCDSTSPLYGCRLVVFIHDELCLEVPEGLGHEAALEVVRIMEEEMQLLTPDIPIRATPALSRCWSKAAEPKYRDGRLVPHEDV